MYPKYLKRLFLLHMAEIVALNQGCPRPRRAARRANVRVRAREPCRARAHLGARGRVPQLKAPRVRADSSRACNRRCDGGDDCRGLLILGPGGSNIVRVVSGGAEGARTTARLRFTYCQIVRVTFTLAARILAPNHPYMQDTIEPFPLPPSCSNGRLGFAC